MKKATVFAFALFAGGTLAGALFMNGSMYAGAQTTTASTTASSTATSTASTTASSTATSTTGTTVRCSPATVTVAPGQSVTLSATGGNGTYQWSSPGLTITNALGANFRVTFNRNGTFPVSVTSGGATATCSVVVAGTAVPGSTNPPTTTPGLPNTGAMPE